MQMAGKFSQVPLGEVAPKSDAVMPSSSELVWNLSLEDIEPQTGRVIRRQTCLASALGSAKCSFDRRHVLYSKLRPYLNKVVLPESSGVGTSELLPLLPDSARLDREFLAFYLRSPGFVDFAVANSRGANLPRVAMKALWAHEVPCPPLSEQRRIVARVKECMDRIGEIRAHRTEISLSAAALLPSSLASTFANLDDEYPNTSVGNCLVESRYGTSRRCSASSTATPVLRIPNVSKGRLSFGDLKYCEIGDNELARLRLRNGDILIVRTNGSPDIVGRCAVYVGGRRTFAFASYLIRLRVNPMKIDPNFLAFFLTSTMGRDAISEIRRTSAGQYNPASCIKFRLIHAFTARNTGLSGRSNVWLMFTASEDKPHAVFLNLVQNHTESVVKRM